MVARLIGRFGFVAANTNQGREDPASKVPKMRTQTRVGQKEAIDARQHVRGAITGGIDEFLRRGVYEQCVTVSPIETRAATIQVER